MRVLMVLLILATAASAVPVDPNASDGIAARIGKTVLCVNGDIWSFNGPLQEWTIGYGLTGSNLPIPVADVADWGGNWFMTHDGTYWFLHGTGSDPQSEWLVMLPPPCQTGVGNEDASMSQMKSMFR